MARFGQEFMPEDRDALIHEARQRRAALDVKLPLGRKVGNFIKAASRHVADGMKKVSLEAYKARLAVCNKCDWRAGGTCTHTDCGCVLSKKCWWASESCPEDKWTTED